MAGARALGVGAAPELRPRARWSVDEAAAWGDRTGWLLGCNFTPSTASNQLELWQDAGIDGINIINQTIPGSYTDFIDGVLPELRKRGLAQTEYTPGTLREKLFGGGPHLPATHPAAAYRGAFAESSATAESRGTVAAR